MTINFSVFCQLFSGSGQILQPRQLYLSPGFAKIAPFRLNITEEDFNFIIKFRYKETFRIFAS